MLARIKKRLKDEKGFTLVELLAVIVILGLIIAIAIPAVGSIMDNARESTDNANATLIEDSARLYDIEHNVQDTGVLVSTLIDQGYLEIRDVEGEPEGRVVYEDNTWVYQPDENTLD